MDMGDCLFGRVSCSPANLGLILWKLSCAIHGMYYMMNQRERRAQLYYSGVAAVFGTFLTCSVLVSCSLFWILFSHLFLAFVSDIIFCIHLLEWWIWFNILIYRFWNFITSASCERNLWETGEHFPQLGYFIGWIRYLVSCPGIYDFSCWKVDEYVQGLGIWDWVWRLSSVGEGF